MNGVPLVVHNIGRGTLEEDILKTYKLSATIVILHWLKVFHRKMWL